ncbi:MAG: phosphate transport system permease protein PstA [Tepidiforma sp.]|nr:phosphate ABC transporter permease PstA [Tepidiforma sp.]GIW19558.1 MAG: phosphate transport system permease protein PstA [Tepidiforma sp.]
MAAAGMEQFPARAQFRPRLGLRKLYGMVFTGIGLAAILVGLGMLAWLLLDTLVTGLPWLDWQFLTGFDSRFPDRAGAKAAIYGTAYMMFFTIVVALPLGVMSAIYLEEYARDGKVKSFIQINIANLAAVPSIIYGLLGLQVFVRWMELGRSVLAGSLTMALLILPIIVVATQEALRAVPPSIRDASYGVGATRWETVRHHVLPYALPGILTGNILAASRAIGESAPLITIGALTYVPFTPENPLDRFTVLPIQIFNWVSRPQEDFQGVAAAGIIVLLAVLLLMNSVAIFLRQKLQRRF